MSTESVKPLYFTFLALMVLLVVTVAMSFAPLGETNKWIGLGIASAKTTLVALFFMGLWRTQGAVRLAAGAGLLWLAFAVVLVSFDYATRGWDATQQPLLKDKVHYQSIDRVAYSTPRIAVDAVRP